MCRVGIKVLKIESNDTNLKNVVILYEDIDTYFGLRTKITKLTQKTTNLDVLRTGKITINVSVIENLHK